MNKKIFNRIISNPVKLAKLASHRANHRENHRENDREKGFTFPAAMCGGLLIIGIAMAASMNAKSGELDAESKNQNQQATAIAEGGLHRVLGKLNDPTYASLLRMDYEESTGWVADESGSASASICANSNSSSNNELKEGEIGKGYFKIQKYEYDNNGTAADTTDDTGELTIDAERVKGNEEAGAARVKVKINLDDPGPKALPNTFPGLYARTYIDIGNNNVLDDVAEWEQEGVNNANVVCENCTTKNTTDQNNYCADPTSPTGQEAAKNAICKAQCPKSDIDGTIYIGKVNLPPVLTPPADPDKKTVKNSF